VSTRVSSAADAAKFARALDEVCQSLAYQIAAQVFFGAPADRAVGAAIVLHAISFVPVTLLGIYFMAREGLTLAGARKMAEDNAPKPSQGSTSVMPRQAESASSVNR